MTNSVKTPISFASAILLASGWFVIGFLLLPMFVVVLASFTDQPFMSLPKESLSTQYYKNFFSSTDWIGSTLRSALVAAVSTLLAVVLGTLCTIGCWRVEGRFSVMVRLMLLAPMMVPTVIEGLAMFKVWVQLGLFDTYFGLILAHTLTGIPYVLVTVSAALARFDLRLEQAARSLGASVPRTIIEVIIPQIRPGIFSGALFVFVHSFDELVVTLFLTSRQIVTLPKQMWSGIQENLDPTIAAVSAIIIAATTMAIVVGRMRSSWDPSIRTSTEAVAH